MPKVRGADGLVCNALAPQTKRLRLCLSVKLSTKASNDEVSLICQFSFRSALA